VRLLTGFDDDVVKFVGSLIPHCQEGFTGPCAGIGVIDDNGLLVGGAVYSGFIKEYGIVELSLAGTAPHWLTRPVMYGMFKYPFIDLDCQMVVCRTSERNKRAIRVQRGYGFKHQTIPRLYGRDENCILGLLTVEDWKANGFHRENIE
jgi:RimJ/RimL family protein N-acetyltransferase